MKISIGDINRLETNIIISNFASEVKYKTKRNVPRKKYNEEKLTRPIFQIIAKLFIGGNNWE